MQVHGLEFGRFDLKQHITTNKKSEMTTNFLEAWLHSSKACIILNNPYTTIILAACQHHLIR